MATTKKFNNSIDVIYKPLKPILKKAKYEKKVLSIKKRNCL